MSSAQSDSDLRAFVQAAAVQCGDTLSPHPEQARLKITLLTAVLARLAVSGWSAVHRKRFVTQDCTEEDLVKQQERFRSYQEQCGLSVLLLSPRLLLLAERDFFDVYENVCRALADYYLHSSGDDKMKKGYAEDTKKTRKKKKQKKMKEKSSPIDLEGSDDNDLVPPKSTTITATEVTTVQESQTLEELLNMRIDSVPTDLSNVETDEWQQVSKSAKKEKQLINKTATNSDEKNPKSLQSSVTSEVGNVSSKIDLDNSLERNDMREFNSSNTSIGVNNCYPNEKSAFINHDDKSCFTLDDFQQQLETLFAEKYGHLLRPNIDKKGLQERNVSYKDFLEETLNEVKLNMMMRKFTNINISESNASTLLDYFSDVLQKVFEKHDRCLIKIHKSYEEEINDLREAHDQAIQTGNLRLFIANNNLSSEREERNKLVETAVAEYIKQREKSVTFS